MTIRTHDIKKDTLVCLDNGDQAIICDNRRTNSRLVMLAATGSLGEVAAYNINRAFINGSWVEVELTPQQQKAKNAAWSILR